MVSGWITSGPKNAEFEILLKNYIKPKYLTTTSNATSALDIAIKLLNPKKGDEILTPSITWPSAVNMIEMNNCKPIFVDVEPDTFNIDLTDVIKKISKRTIAVIPIHFAGQSYDTDGLKKILFKKKIKIIEDCSHAIGTFYKNKHVGSSVDFAVFSFHPNKNITAAEGGLITFQKKTDYEKALKLKYHGLPNDTYSRTLKKKKPNEVIFPGMKYIFSDVHASIGISQFKKLSIILKKRKMIANQYIEYIKKLKNIENLKIKNFDDLHSWHLFIIKFKLKKLKINFKQIKKIFDKEKINIGIHYYPMHLHKFYRSKYKIKKGDLKYTTELNNTFISLPLYPALSNTNQKRIFKVLYKIDKLEC